MTTLPFGSLYYLSSTCSRTDFVKPFWINVFKTNPIDLSTSKTSVLTLGKSFSVSFDCVFHIYSVMTLGNTIYIVSSRIQGLLFFKCRCVRPLKSIAWTIISWLDDTSVLELLEIFLFWIMLKHQICAF